MTQSRDGRLPPIEVRRSRRFNVVNSHVEAARKGREVQLSSPRSGCQRSAVQQIASLDGLNPTIVHPKIHLREERIMCKFWVFVSLLSEILVVRVGVSFSQTASHLTWVSDGDKCSREVACGRAWRLQGNVCYWPSITPESSVRKERRWQRGRLVRNVRNVRIEQE
jgi:hypothetical protein